MKHSERDRECRMSRLLKLELCGDGVVMSDRCQRPSTAGMLSCPSLWR